MHPEEHYTAAWWWIVFGSLHFERNVKNLKAKFLISKCFILVLLQISFSNFVFNFVMNICFSDN